MGLLRFTRNDAHVCLVKSRLKTANELFQKAWKKLTHIKILVQESSLLKLSTVRVTTLPLDPKVLA